MKSKWLAGAWGLLGFVVGTLVGPKVSGGAAASSNESSGATAVAGNSSVRQEGHTRDSESRPKRAGADRIEAAKKSAEPRISIPVSEVSKLVTKHFEIFDELFGGMDQLKFKADSFEEVFVLMDFSESERESTKAVFDRAASQLRALEMSNAKIRKSGPDGIELDLSEVRKASTAILEEARQDFLHAIPDARGQCIAEAIRWDACVYGSSFRNGKTMPNEAISLRIERDRKGGLWAKTQLGSSARGTGLDKDQYPDDGTIIEAASHFDVRWRPWLSGVNFLPVDEE